MHDGRSSTSLLPNVRTSKAPARSGGFGMRTPWIDRRFGTPSAPSAPIPDDLTGRERLAGTRAGELANQRTAFDMDLDRQRLDLDKTDREFQRSRSQALDALERERFGIEKTRSDRAATMQDELLRMARGDASPLPTPSATGSAPAQLGIISNPVQTPASDGLALQRTQVQDRAAERTAGRLKALEARSIDRGILGSSLYEGLVKDVIGDQSGDLLDADTEMALAGLQRQQAVEDRDFAARERGVERGERRRLSLLDLLAQGARY